MVFPLKLCVPSKSCDALCEVALWNACACFGQAAMLKSEKPVALDGGWYEQQLARDERRGRGHYSTPPELVARLLEWVGYCAGADLEHLALLDPSCGVGNFLAGAA